MKRSGFTLIELLAVIVILAIIALIATPIVLNIINDAKSESELRSADFYLDALELSIAQSTLKGQNITDGTYNVLESGNICLEALVNDKCPAGKELEVEVKGDAPKEGTIVILNGEIDGASLILDDKEIMKNSKGELVYVKTLEEVCELQEGTAKTKGAKYKCKVDPNKEPYTFYVLSYSDKNGNIVTTKPEEGSVNLIMDSNIRKGGEAVKEPNPTEEEKGLVDWITKADYLSVGGKPEEWSNWSKGPITAMNYLEEATKNWTNTNEIKISKFTDDVGNSYTMGKKYNINARMPYYSEVDTLNENNGYLYEYLEAYEEWENDQIPQPTNNVSGIYAYWTFTPYFDGGMDTGLVLSVESAGIIGVGGLFNYNYGVRPVIILKI